MKAIILILSLISCFCAPTERTQDGLSCAAHELLKKIVAIMALIKKLVRQENVAGKKVQWKVFHGVFME